MLWLMVTVSWAQTTVGEVLDTFSREPTIREVQQWAADAVMADPDRVARLLRHSRSAWALPELTVDLRWRNDWDEGFAYYDWAGAEPLPGSDALAVSEDADLGQTQEVRVRLRWELSGLVMSPERLRAVDEAQNLAKLRERVLTEVTQRYFERRRAQVEALLAPKPDLWGQTEDHLRLEEITASLDAFTGGRFATALARPPSPR